jgi:hypothetical protein
MIVIALGGDDERLAAQRRRGRADLLGPARQDRRRDGSDTVRQRC